MTFISENQSAYNSLRSAINRCYSENDTSYVNYGAKGVTVCDEWRDFPSGAFKKFMDHIGPKPDNTTLDRIDNSLGYQPGNVRWISRVEQNYNRSISLSGEDRNLIKDIVEKTGVSASTAFYRIKRGHDLFAPRQQKGPRPDTVRKTGKREPAVIKPAMRSNGEDRNERNMNIGRDWDAGIRQVDIAAKYGLSRTTILLIVKGKL